MSSNSGILTIEVNGANSVVSIDSVTGLVDALAAKLASDDAADFYQPLNPKLQAIANVSLATDKMIYWSNSTYAQATNLSTFSREMLGGDSVSAWRTLLSVSNTGSDTTYAFRANNLSDLASASAARTNLGLAIGTDVQAYDADLATWAGLTPSLNAQSLVTAADYSAMRSLLSLVPGTNFLTPAAIAAAYQPLDSDLTSIAALSTTSFGRDFLTRADASASRTYIGVTASGSDTTYAYRANNLSDLASVSSSRTNLGVGTSDSPQFAGLTITGNVSADNFYTPSSSGFVGQSGGNNGITIYGSTGGNAVNISAAGSTRAAITSTGISVTGVVHASALVKGEAGARFEGSTSGAGTGQGIEITNGNIIQTYNRTSGSYGASLYLDGASIVMRPAGSTALSVASGAIGVTGNTTIVTNATYIFGTRTNAATSRLLGYSGGNVCYIGPVDVADDSVINAAGGLTTVGGNLTVSGGTATISNGTTGILNLGPGGTQYLYYNGGTFALTGALGLSIGGWVKPSSYTVGTVPSAATSGAGAMIYVSNETGGAVIAFSDGSNWKRVTDRATIA